MTMVTVTLQKRWRPCPLIFRCGVALDTWMFPIDEEIFPRVKQPIFFINSEKFQWGGNIARIRKLDSAYIPRKMITIRGTVHQSFPDFTFLTGHCLGKLLKLKGDLDSYIAMDLCNRASLAFLQRHLSLDREFNQWDPLIDGKDENLIPGTNVRELQASIWTMSSRREGEAFAPNVFNPNGTGQWNDNARPAASTYFSLSGAGERKVQHQYEWFSYGYYVVVLPTWISLKLHVYQYHYFCFYWFLLYSTEPREGHGKMKIKGFWSALESFLFPHLF